MNRGRVDQGRATVLGYLRIGRRVDWERRRGCGTHESGSLSPGTLSRETRIRGARLREDSRQGGKRPGGDTGSPLLG